MTNICMHAHVHRLPIAVHVARHIKQGSCTSIGTLADVIESFQNVHVHKYFPSLGGLMPPICLCQILPRSL